MDGQVGEVEFEGVRCQEWIVEADKQRYNATAKLERIGCISSIQYTLYKHKYKYDNELLIFSSLSISADLIYFYFFVFFFSHLMELIYLHVRKY